MEHGWQCWTLQRDMSCCCSTAVCDLYVTVMSHTVQQS